MKKTTIFEGARFISAAVVKVQQGNVIKERMENEEARRKARAAREERMLGNDRSIFAACKVERPQRRRVSYCASSEEAGRCESFVVTFRSRGTTTITERRGKGSRYHKASVRTYEVGNYGGQACKVRVY